MAQPNPLKIYGMSDDIGQKLLKKPPLMVTQLKRLLSREQILSIFVSNNINDERIRHSKIIC
jgi:hypothetical protein